MMQSKTFTHRLKFSAAMVALMAPSLSYAQTQSASSEDFSEVDMQEWDQRDLITVYSTTNPMPVLDYPGQVTVIDRELIDTIIPSTLSDILRDVPGVEFSGGPRRTGEAPAIRGLSGENILILLDGARQSFISAHDGRFFIDPDLISSAEIVRGPASALYGSGAVGGVLALETVDADDLLQDDQTWGVRTRLGYQSVNEEYLASLTAFTRQGDFDAIANIGIRQSGDIKLGSGADLPSDDDIQNALVKLGYQFTDDLRLEGSWQRFTNTALEPNNGQGTLGTGNSLLDRDVEKDVQSDTFRAQLQYTPDTPWVDTTIIAYQTTSSVDEFDATIPRTTLRDIETTGVSARNASRFEFGQTNVIFTVGADLYKDEQVGTDSETNDNLRGGVPNGEAEFTGLFAQAEMTVQSPLGLPGDLIVIPGVRYDRFESSSDSAAQQNEDEATSPRFAISYGPNEWFRIFWSYAEGFRAPSINELFLNGVHFSLPHPQLFNPMMGQFVFVNNNFIPNPNLKPEETQTFEVGVSGDFADLFSQGDRLKGKISYFESDIDDLINLSVDVTFDPTCFIGPTFFPCSGGTTESANLEKAEINGVEAEFRYDSERLFAQAQFSSVDGENSETGSDIGTLTPDRFSMNAAWKFPDQNLSLGSRLQYARDFERREAAMGGGFNIVEERDSYTVVDLYTTWRPNLIDGLRIDLGVDNVFDEDYERVFEGVSEPGRNYKVSLAWQFGM